MQKNKSLRHNFLSVMAYIGIGLFIFIFSFCFYYSIIHHLYKLQILNSLVCMILVIVLSAITVIITLVLLVIYINSQKENKFLFFIGNNWPKILFGMIIILILSISIRYEVLWTIEETKEVLTIIWTILGLSITIFLVWNVVIIQYLKKQTPKKINKKDYLQKYGYLLAKQNLASNVKAITSTIIMLTINLILALISTVLIYMIKKPDTLIVQNILICTFYFSTNTLISLFVDMLKPVFQDKKILLKENNVTFEEIKETRALAFLQQFIRETFKIIDKDETKSEEEKKQEKEDFINQLKQLTAKNDKSNSIDDSKHINDKENNNGKTK